MENAAPWSHTRYLIPRRPVALYEWWPVILYIAHKHASSSLLVPDLGQALEFTSDTSSEESRPVEGLAISRSKVWQEDAGPV